MKVEKEKPRQVLPFARFTAGHTVVLRQQIEEQFRIEIGKPMSDLRPAEQATLEALFEQAHVGTQTVALHELPSNRADRRRLLKELDGPVVRAERRGRYGRRKKRAR